jgi:hypothetical protein
MLWYIAGRCMVREIGRLGVTLLLVLACASCAAPPAPNSLVPPVPLATATPPTAHGSWAQALVFSGDIDGAMNGVVAGGDATRSECSGRNSRTAAAWASALFGPVGTDVYEVVATVRPYRGPGVYRAPDASVQVARPDGSAAWQTLGADAVTFTVGVDEESGTVDATLTNLTSAAPTLRLTGRWSCRT